MPSMHGICHLHLCHRCCSSFQVVVLPDNSGALHTICSPTTPSGNDSRASVMRAHEGYCRDIQTPGRPPLMAHCPGSGRQLPDYFARVPCPGLQARQQALPPVPPLDSLAQLQRTVSPHCSCRSQTGHELYTWHADDCVKCSHTLQPVSLFSMDVWQ